MLVAILLGLMTFAQSQQDPGCTQWQQCREMALEAAERGEFETFHDLAWRAVQTGPPRDPGLMFMLARAQALSGRPHDALVMLDRLAQMGIAPDVDATDDFARTKQLPEWPAVAARIEQLGNSAASADTPAAVPAAPARASTPAGRRSARASAAKPAPKPARTPPEPAPKTATAPPEPAPRTAAAPPEPAPSPAAPPLPTPTSEPAPPPAAAPTPASPTPAPVARAEAVRFLTDRKTVVGLAYDAVSRRYLFGDRVARKLIVVSEGSNHPLDLVRAESAGFLDIGAFAIDDRRGDLWVATAADADGAGTLHRLQLVSGRPLKTFRVAPDSAPVDPVDVAITSGGAVLVLDAAGRILELRPGASSVETLMRLETPGLASIAVGNEDGVAYVAHQGGVSRIDLRTRKSTALGSPKGASLPQLQQIRWYRNALIGVAIEDTARTILRFESIAAGRSISRTTTIDSPAAMAGRGSVTISGSDLLYLAPAAEDTAEFVAYRIHLR